MSIFASVRTPSGTASLRDLTLADIPAIADYWLLSQDIFRSRAHIAIDPSDAYPKCGVNRMLDKFIPVSETKYVENSDGVALPGEFHIRYVTRDDIPRLFARLSQLP